MCDADHVLVGIQGGTQACLPSGSEAFKGCIFYDDDAFTNCLKCKAGLNALPVNDGKGYLCSELPPIKGDGGVKFTSCIYYDPTDTSGDIVQCVKCSDSPAGATIASYDCSIDCPKAGDSVRYYMDTEVTFDC